MRVWGLVLASAVLYLLAFPPVNAGLLVLVSFVPWFVALKESNRRQAGWGGFLWGFLVMGVNMIWIPSLVTQWTGSAALGWLPWVIAGCIGGAYYAFMAHLMRRALDRKWEWSIPLLWVGFEIVRTYAPGLAFPYFLAATPLWPYPFLIQAAGVGTIYLVSAWVLAVNVLIFAWLVKSPYRPMRPLLAIVTLLTVFSVMQFNTPLPGEPIVVAAGQPGVNMAFRPEDVEQRLFGAMVKVNAEARTAKTRLLILPEAMCQSDASGVPHPPFDIDPELPTLLGGHRIAMAGSIERTGTEADIKRYQSAFAVENGKSTYVDKARLVVFGEYVPGRGIIPFLDKFKLSDNDLTPGDRTRSIKVGGLEVGPLICFEALFWDVAHKQSENGAQLLAIMSLDDWYMGTPAPDQLRAAAIWRAVETGLPVVRSATTGYTMGVDQRGRVIKQLKLGETAALLLQINVEQAPQKRPARVVFPWVFGLSLPVLMVLLYWKRKDG